MDRPTPLCFGGYLTKRIWYITVIFAPETPMHRPASMFAVLVPLSLAVACDQQTFDVAPVTSPWTTIEEFAERMDPTTVWGKRRRRCLHRLLLVRCP